jgi:glycosyltransferase involved in cell wall biosynthesis
MRELLRGGSRRGRVSNPDLLVVMTTVAETIRVHYAGLLEEIAGAGIQVAVATSPDVTVEKELRDVGIAFLPVSMKREPNITSDIGSVMRAVVVLLRVRPAAINYGTPKAALVGALASWLCRVPRRVYTLHGLRLETLRGPARIIGWLSEWLVARLSTHVVCVSESVRREGIQRGLFGSKASVLGHGSANGVDARRFAAGPAPADVRSALGIPAGDRVVGFVGRIEPDKGIDSLVEAFRVVREGCPEAHLLLVGPQEGWERLKPSTQKFLSDEPRVHTTGAVGDAARYYGVMDCFVLPTRREGLPAVLLEAAVAGTPVVASRATGVVDVLDESTGWLVPIDSPSELATAMLEILSGGDEVDRRVAANRMRVRQRFDQSVVWEHWVQFFHRLLAVKSVA